MEVFAFAIIPLFFVVSAFWSSERRTRLILTATALLMVAGFFLFVLCFRGLESATNPMGLSPDIDTVLIWTFCFGLFLLVLGATAVKLAK